VSEPCGTARRGVDNTHTTLALRHVHGCERHADPLAVEVIHLDDLSNAAKLLAEFCLSVGPEQSWVP